MKQSKDEKNFIVTTEKGSRVIPALLVMYLKRKYDIKLFNGQFRVKKNHYYSEISNIKLLVSHEIPENLRKFANIEETANLLEVDKQLILNEKDLAAENFISFKNGVLDVATMKFSEHSNDSKLIFINQVDYNWNTSAKTDKMTDKFFNTTCDGNQKDIDFLYQVLGVAMSGYRDFKNFFYFTGLKDTGKSQYLHLAESLLKSSDGSLDYSSIPLKTLTDETSKEFVGIIGKRANISAETPSQLHIKNDVLLKAMTGGDRIRAERKFMEAIPFVNKAMLMFAGNDIPQFFTSDKGSIGERIMIYKFKNAVPLEQQIKSVHLKLDMEYIIQKAVKQLEIFVKNNQRFEEPEEAAYNREFMQMESDSIYKYFKKRLVIVDGSKSRISTETMYDDYLLFMVKEGHLENDSYTHKPNISKFKITRYVFNVNMKKFIGEERYKRNLMCHGEKTDVFINVRMTTLIEEYEKTEDKKVFNEYQVDDFYDITGTQQS